MKKYIVTGLLLAALTVLPSVTSAQSITDLLAKIEVLKQWLAVLQGQQNQSGSWCHTFNQSMGVGTKEENEVSALKTSLGFEGVLKVLDNRIGVYDEIIAAAISQFQLKYKSEILTPNGLNAPTGYFGPATRKKMNSLYGCKLAVKPPTITNYSPVINSLSTYSGPVGTLVDIRGGNLAGFENDRNVWIESSNGTRGILYGDNSVSTSNLIRVTLNSPLCQTDNSYSGQPCNSWLNLTPGFYKFQVITPSGSSNKLNFEITSIASGDTTANTPHIDSITPISGPVGTTVEIRGSNLSGFEGDLIAVFERSDRKVTRLYSIVPYSTGVMYGPLNTTLIKVKVEPPCQRGQTVYGDYSGIPSTCDYFEFTPGTYKVYVNPWGKKSNEVQFIVT